MAKKKSASTGKSSSTPPNEINSQDDYSSRNSGVIMAEFCEGLSFICLQVVNPSYGTGDENDRWYFTNIPLENTPMCVKTGFSGFTRRGALERMADIMLKEPERALEHICEFPRVTDTLKAKILNIWVHLL